MTGFFEELFAYNHHCNQQLAMMFRQQEDKLTERSTRWFSHVLNAHHIWNSRVLSTTDNVDTWQIHTVAELAMIDKNNYTTSLQILGQLDLHEVIQYVTKKGQPFSNTVRDILFHVINHSTYHRGQIAAEFRQHGLEPLVSDYVFYKR